MNTTVHTFLPFDTFRNISQYSRYYSRTISFLYSLLKNNIDCPEFIVKLHFHVPSCSAIIQSNPTF